MRVWGGGGIQREEANPLFGAAEGCVSRVASEKTGGIVDSVLFGAYYRDTFASKREGFFFWGGASVLVRGGLHPSVNRSTAVD